LSHHRTEVRTPSLQRGKEEEFAQQPAILSGNQLLGVSERVVRGEVPQDDEHLIESTLYILTPHLGRLHSGRNELEGLARVVDEVEQFTAIGGVKRRTEKPLDEGTKRARRIVHDVF